MRDDLEGQAVIGKQFEVVVDPGQPAPLRAIRLLHDDEVVAEVAHDDPLLEQIEALAREFGEACLSVNTATFYLTSDTKPRKARRVDTSEADAVWDRALKLIYAQRIGPLP